MTGHPLNVHHVRVLKAFYDGQGGEGGMEHVHTFATIAERTGWTGHKSPLLVRDARRITRFLKRRGYVSFHQAFSYDDSTVVGSGHMITKEGIDYINNLIKKDYFKNG